MKQFMLTPRLVWRLFAVVSFQKLSTLTEYSSNEKKTWIIIYHIKNIIILVDIFKAVNHVCFTYKFCKDGNFDGDQ
jgi:hypothetical protein